MLSAIPSFSVDAFGRHQIRTVDLDTDSESMEANVTELAQIVETLRQEISLLRGNVTSSALSASRVAGQLESLGTDMDSMWLMLGAILVVCEIAVPSTVRW